MILNRIPESLRTGVLEYIAGSNLKARAARGGIWVTAAMGSEYGFRLLRNIILARILLPEAFGTMAIIISVCMAFETFSDIGIKQAIIQSPKGADRLYLNGAWWVAFIRGVLLYAVAYAGAPLIAGFFSDPELIILIRVASLSILFRGAMSSKAYAALKQMKYRQWVSISSGGAVAGIFAAIVIAFWIQSIWALVYGYILEGVARLILSYMLCPFRPSIYIEKYSLRALIRYAKGMAGVAILTFVFFNADIFVIGKLLSHATLGLYSMAAALAFGPMQLIATILNEIMMPPFSQINTETGRINHAILKITEFIAYMGVPLLVFVVFNGSDLLAIIYGPTYAGVALPFTFMFGSALMSTACSPVATYYFASGRPNEYRTFTGIRAIVIMIIIFPATYIFGVTGAAITGTLAMGIGYFLQMVKIRKITGLDLWVYSKPFLLASAISLWVVLGWFLSYFMQTGHLGKIILGIFSCLIAYAQMVFFKQRTQLRGLKAGTATSSHEL